ncbi:MAG: hypothetical protein R2815_03715 [Flavobacteriales bacterium]
MPRIPFALFVGFMTTATFGQIGTPQWSNVPFKGEEVFGVQGPYCSNGTSYAFGRTHPVKFQYAGYVFPKEGEGSALERPIDLPVQKNHDTFNSFCVLGGRPCVVYDTWDKKTGVVTVMAQRYTEQFLPDGTPVQLGKIPLDAKSYGGGRIRIQAYQSPDNSKTLFLFDDIQMGGIKLAMCWVVDNELELVWGGAYRIPVASYGSSSATWVMDNGDVLMRINAVVLDEDNTKEKRDGSTQVKNSVMNDKQSSTFYRLHGETFVMWDAELPGLNGSFEGAPTMIGDRILMGGYVKPNERRSKARTWVVLEMDEKMAPTVVASGSASREEPISFGKLVSGPDQTYLLLDHRGYVTVMKLDKEMRVEWEHSSPWEGVGAYVHGDHLYMPALGRNSNWKDVQDGKEWDEGAYVSNGFWPMLLRWDATGGKSLHRFLPEDVDSARQRGWGADFRSIGSCGCYVDHSYEKAHPGLVRVQLD